MLGGCGGIVDAADSRFPARKRKKEKTFSRSCQAFQLEYAALTGGQRSPKWVRVLGDKIRCYLNPFFGDLGLSEVTSGKIQEYRLDRVTNSKAGKPPARSAMHHDLNSEKKKPPSNQSASP